MTTRRPPLLARPGASRGTPLVACLALLLVCAGCASTPEPAPLAIDQQEAERIDRINRLSEYLAVAPAEDGPALLRSLERLMIAWQTEQRQGRAEPLENIINRKVVGSFDLVADAFVDGSHDEQLVAAWALGFSRVPENPLGIVSPHEQAVALLLSELDDAPDDLMCNLTLALWKIGDPQTPLPPLLDLVVNHHDPEVRANATLALTSVLDMQTAVLARDAVLVALVDNEPKVRLHAATVAAQYPDPSTSLRMASLLADEPSPLVRASMARALGRAKDKTAAPALISMLASPRRVEATTAHLALVSIYDKDLGTSPESWRSVLE